MTRIKENLLWMMYRSGWATKPGQEAVLAIMIERLAFEYLLSKATHSIFQPDLYLSQSFWKKSHSESDVQLQWDPDHDPAGTMVDRRAIQ